MKPLEGPLFVAQLVPGESCRQKALAREREWDARGIDRDPAAAPLLRHVCGSPEPHVGSSTRSPGSVVIRIQRWMTCGLFEQRKFLSRRSLTLPVSAQILVDGKTGKSLSVSNIASEFPTTISGASALSRSSPSGPVFQFPGAGSYVLPFELILEVRPGGLWLVMLSWAKTRLPSGCPGKSAQRFRN